MVLNSKKAKAFAMRKQGMSYSAIKAELNVSKSTLSLWLRELPLTRERINELRAHSEVRIERFRNTMKQKRDTRLSLVNAQAKNDLGSLTKREVFIAGLFLYWGEGGKTSPYRITLSNTDPKMIRCYLVWLKQLGVPKVKVKIRLHLYADMDIEKETKYWINVTRLGNNQFRKPYIKKTLYTKVNERSFGHGTCDVIVDERDVAEYVLQLLESLRSKF